MPHLAQKRRDATAEDWNVVVSPDRVNDDSGTLNQATKGAPVVRRQIEQWHTLSCVGVPVVS